MKICTQKTIMNEMKLVIVIQNIVMQSLWSGIAFNLFNNYVDEGTHGKVVKFRTGQKLW